MKCMNCGTKNEKKAEYCVKCGHNLSPMQSIFAFLTVLATVIPVILIKVPLLQLEGEGFGWRELGKHIVYIQEMLEAFGQYSFVLDIDLLLVLLFLLFWALYALMTLIFLIGMLIGKRGNKTFRFARIASTFSIMQILFITIICIQIDTSSYSEFGIALLYPTVGLIAVLIINLINKIIFIPKTLRAKAKKGASVTTRVCKQCGNTYSIGSFCPACGSSEIQ